MTATYADYSRERIGWFFGMSGWQLGGLAAASLPVFWAVSRAAWAAAGLLVLVWTGVLLVTVVPLRGRSATGWCLAMVCFAVGGLAGWTRFRARAASGAVEDLATPDLPGVLAGVEIQEGPPHGPGLERVAIVQDHARRTWAVTARVIHPGVGMDAGEEREAYGQALAELIDIAGRTEKIDEVLFTVRTVPEDGAERELWVGRHHHPGGPQLSRQVNGELAEALTQASVRTEQFLTLVVPEQRIAKPAKESGGGLEGRGRELGLLMGEVEAHLRGPVGMSEVRWLTSPELAAVCRTGFAPGDRAGIVAALAEQRSDSGVNADVPWAQAGPSAADVTVRHYSHDAWNSVSATIRLPNRGAVMGALAPVLAPGEAGERRSFTVAYPIVPARTADRRSGNAEWAADTAAALRGRLGMKMRAQQREEADRAYELDTKLARGHALTRPYAVATVTVPKTKRVSEFARRLDASIRRAGFAPLRLDAAQDAGFVVSTIPLGVSLTRRGDA